MYLWIHRYVRNISNINNKNLSITFKSFPSCFGCWKINKLYKWAKLSRRKQKMRLDGPVKLWSRRNLFLDLNRIQQNNSKTCPRLAFLHQECTCRKIKFINQLIRSLIAVTGWKISIGTARTITYWTTIKARRILSGTQMKKKRSL